MMSLAPPHPPLLTGKCGESLCDGYHTIWTLLGRWYPGRAVDTNKEVGDVNHLEVFATPELADEWLRDTIRKAWHSNMRFWSDRYDKA
jgi:hypothetical protein